jgi:hypothetical protein
MSIRTPADTSPSIPAFFVPGCQGRSAEDMYQKLRKQTALRMERTPSPRRIAEIWTRRGNVDCVTTVGAPDPISGDIVTAIFDMGPHQPFVVCRRNGGTPHEELFEVLGCNAYSISEFSS